MAKAKKYVYHFGKSKTDGNGTMKALLGGKGANLAEMKRIGLPVPPGFTLTTDVCTYYYAHKKSYPRVLNSQIQDGVRRMEKEMGKKFGDKKNPLLLSVRSGARESTALGAAASELGLRVFPGAHVYGGPLIGSHVGADVAAGRP